MPFSFLAMILWAPFAALWQVIHKEPAKASGEISAAASNFVRLPSLLKARFRNARSAKVPRSTLKPLLATPREVWRERRDLRLARAEAKRVASGPTELQKQELKALAGPRRAGLAFVLVTSLVAALATFGPWLGSLLAGGRFAGGALLPATGNLADVWQAATSGWNFGNLGASVPGDPLLLTLVPLTAVAGGSLQLAVNLALLLALPLAALGAWFAAGALTRTVWVRIVAALSWAACAGMLLILGDGLLGALVTQLALPWLLLAVVRALGLQATDGTSERAIREEVRALSEPGVPTKYSSEARNFEGWEGAEPAGDPATDAQESKPRKGSLAAACLASLWLAVVVSGAPVLLPVALVLILVGLFFAGRSRWLLLLLPIPAMVLGAPWWWRVFQTGAIPGNTDGLITPVVSDRNLRPLFEAPLSNPTYVLQDSVANADPLSGLALLLGQPTLPETWRTDFPWALAPAILLGAVILIAALVALVISWFSGVSARAFGATQPPQTEAVGRVAAQRRVKTTAGIAFLFIATAGGLGIALMAVALGVAPTAGVSLITLSLGAAAVLVSGVSLRSYAAAPPPYTRRFAATQPPEVGTSRSAALRVLRGVGIALLVALPISSLVTGLVVARDGSHLGHVQVSTESVVPAVGRQMQASGQRILQVSTRGFDTPLRGYSTAGTTTAGTDGATADALTEWTLLRADGSSLLDASVLARDLDAGQSTLTQLVGELAGGQSGDVVARLASNGIGAVQVPATERGELVTTLDLTPGLERVTEGEGVLLWRVVTDVTALAPSPNFPERHLWLVVSAVTVAAFALLALPLGRKDSDA